MPRRNPATPRHLKQIAKMREQLLLETGRTAYEWAQIIANDDEARLFLPTNLMPSGRPIEGINWLRARHNVSVTCGKIIVECCCDDLKSLADQHSTAGRVN